MMDRLLDKLGCFFFGSIGDKFSKYGIAILSVLAVLMLAGRWFVC